MSVSSKLVPTLTTLCLIPSLVVAEKIGRQWIGIDIWEGAHDLVETRLANTTGLFGTVHYETDMPVRTDDGETASPCLRIKVRVKEPGGKRWTRAEMYDHLPDQRGAVCQGCDRTFDDPRNLELDHNTPRSDGGINHISNRILPCGPCNRLKSNTLTLSGLQKMNQKRGGLCGSQSPRTILFLPLRGWRDGERASPRRSERSSHGF